MKLSEIVDILDAKVHTGEDDLDNEVLGACSSDLMSDVLAFSKNSAALLTGLVNTQVIRTAEMLDIVCVIFVRNKKPNQDVLDLAKELGIVVLSTEYTMYYASGRLYEAGLGHRTNAEQKGVRNE